MKKIIQNIITDKDYELLNKVVPTNPCKKCNMFVGVACCGCPEARTYKKAIQPIEDNNLIEVYKNVEAIRNKIATIKNLKRETAKLMAILKQEGFDLEKLGLSEEF